MYCYMNHVKVQYTNFDLQDSVNLVLKLIIRDQLDGSGGLRAIIQNIGQKLFVVSTCMSQGEGSL